VIAKVKRRKLDSSARQPRRSSRPGLAATPQNPDRGSEWAAIEI